jgi:primary-amine oxidase
MIDGIQLSQVYKANPGFALLDASEVDSAIDEVKSRHAGRPLQFMEVAFKEPTKEEMASHISNSNEYYAVPRKAEVTTFCLESNSTIVDIVSLDKLSPDHRTSTFRQDVQPPVSPSEYELCEKMCKEYPPLLDVLKARGLDPQWLVVDAWCVGPETPAASERIVWPSMFYFDQNPAADGKGTVDNICYARPIEGIEIRISLTRKEVIRFDDLGLYTLPVPGSLDATTSRYVPPAQQRTDLKPIVITQPQGPSFAVDGNRVTWQNFSLQVGFNGREGCTLHFVEFHNRPVVHRLSMCEMVVPYGDPRSPHHLKNAFDAGLVTSKDPMKGSYVRIICKDRHVRIVM